MTRPNILPQDELHIALAALPEWTIAHQKLHRTFDFKDFSAAWGFMARAALVAEKMNHHPEWLNVYSTVDVKLSTHDAGGITSLDIEMARAMDALFS